MERNNLNKLFLKTAFSCMACDGDIDKREVSLIKNLHNETKIFGDIDINQELGNLLSLINKDSHTFLRDFLKELSEYGLTEDEELKLIEVVIDIIKADDKIEYSEIKFFKVIRNKLKISNAQILDVHPDFEEYLEQDIIIESYLTKFQNDFFDIQDMSKFELINSIDANILKNLVDEK